MAIANPDLAEKTGGAYSIDHVPVSCYARYSRPLGPLSEAIRHCSWRSSQFALNLASCNHQHVLASDQRVPIYGRVIGKYQDGAHTIADSDRQVVSWAILGNTRRELWQIWPFGEETCRMHHVQHDLRR